MEIGKKELEEIKSIAVRLINNSGGSIFEPLDPNKFLIQALHEWLERKGVQCGWRVKE